MGNAYSVTATQTSAAMKLTKVRKPPEMWKRSKTLVMKWETTMTAMDSTQTMNSFPPRREGGGWAGVCTGNMGRFMRGTEVQSFRGSELQRRPFHSEALHL